MIGGKPASIVLAYPMEIVDPKNPSPTNSFASDCSRGHINHVIKMEQN